MYDFTTLTVAVCGVGFGLGMCGLGLIWIVNRLDDRDDKRGPFQT